ncbi:hypothetical protein NUSPORA_02063 [Nucleospora cyclopteri]
MPLEEELNQELSKIFTKTMECSLKRKEVSDLVNQIAEKLSDKTVNCKKEENLRKIRLEFEEIRKSFYDLK